MSIIGSVPSHALYGVPVYGTLPAGQIAGSQPAPPSGPYLGRGNKCSAEMDSCEGFRTKNSEYCAGHGRSLAKQAPIEPLAEVSDGV
ncbi:hypothetical protein UFOVP923_3 [uncultured Caudovirales phage]|uniref:Uncharacterized protein n=1 Tax=uncultured Caudovirales phage TaxID=2100421 RepID=A0A6J5PQI4_9CAUD|nr:hypothetical protein UFOVP923_3 [uncultured Caudovirales phage]